MGASFAFDESSKCKEATIAIESDVSLPHIFWPFIGHRDFAIWGAGGSKNRLLGGGGTPLSSFLSSFFLFLGKSVGGTPRGEMNENE